MRIILAFILFHLFCGCSTEESSEAQVYHIIKHSLSIQVDTSDIPPPPPPLIFFGQHNFVLIDTSRVFYHDNHVFYSCGNGVDFSKPPRLFLAPDSLTEISISRLPDFLRNNIPDPMQNHREVSANISAPTDTITNRAFKMITEYFKVKNIKRYGIRNWTEEENFATTAKIQHSSYDPNIADFKVGFDVQFVPPADSIGVK